MKLSPGDLVMVHYMRRGGSSISEIARAFKVTRRTISRWLALP